MAEITNKQSILSTFKALKEALACTNKNYTWLQKSCNSQNSLASIDNESEKIKPMSLNTFKTYADTCIKGGFDTVNAYRIELNKKETAKSKLKSNTGPSLETQLEEANRYRAVLVKAYNDLNRITLDALTYSTKHQYDYDKHQMLYSAYFSLKLVKGNK